MFSVALNDDRYNNMFFKFETLEEANSFIKLVLNSVDKENVTGFSVRITYHEEYRVEGGEE